MFSSLSDKLTGVLDKLKGKGALSESDVDEAMHEIRVALLEADVALPVVKDFIASVREKAVGEDVIKSITPAQLVTKIVHDELVKTLGTANESLNLATNPPAVILMLGLQGSGKTTSTGKLAKFLTEKQNKKVLMASLDIYRPAAQEQLAQIGGTIGVDTLPVIPNEKPEAITTRALTEAKQGGYDVLLLDTAGRTHIDMAMLAEASAIKNLAHPIESLLVVDALTGQDAVNIAKEFDDKIGITGTILTRIDGDSRGGAALSVKFITGKPIKFLGIGEKSDALEPFYPDRLAGRILGMGDVVSLVETAMNKIDEDEAQKAADSMMKGTFNFNDMLAQMRQIKKMGDIKSVIGMIPGLSKMTKQIDESKLDDSILKHQEAIILSMTPRERKHPEIIKASRKQRIAAGSGTSVQEVNKMLKRFEQMQEMMKRMKKLGGLKALMSGGVPPSLDALMPKQGGAFPFMGKNFK